MKLNRVLKFLAVLAFFWAFFPALVVVNLFVAYNFPSGLALCQLLAITLSGFLGYGVSVLSGHICPKGTCGGRLFLYNLLRYGSAAAIVAAAMVLFPQPSAFAAAIIMCITFFAGQPLYFKHYYNVLKIPVVMIHICSVVILALLVWGIQKNRPDLECPFDQIAVVLLFFLCIYVITKSQGTLDSLMDRRGHKMSAFPQNVRYYNFILVCVLLLGLGAVFLFRRQIGGLLDPLVGGLMFGLQCVGAVILWLRWPFEVFRKKGLSFSKGDIPEFSLPGTKEDISHLIAFVLILAVVLLIVYNWKHIVSVFRRFGKWVRSLSQKLFWSRAAKKEARVGAGDYIDEEINLLQDEELDTSFVSGWKAWRRSYRLFRKMEDSEKKLRFGFQLLVEWLHLKGVPVQSSDTPLEILEKSENMIAGASTKVVTDGYNGIRYGDRDADLESMRRLVEMLKRLEARARLSREEKKARRKDGKEGK